MTDIDIDVAMTDAVVRATEGGHPQETCDPELLDVTAMAVEAVVGRVADALSDGVSDGLLSVSGRWGKLR